MFRLAILASLRLDGSAPRTFTWSGPTAPLHGGSLRKTPSKALPDYRRKRIISSEWAAVPSDRRPWVKLSWNGRGLSVLGKKLIVYGVRPGQGLHRLRYVIIKGFELEAFRNNKSVKKMFVGLPIEYEGTKVSLARFPRFDELKITMYDSDISGSFEGNVRAALSEIAVVGQVQATEPTNDTFSFIRGDSDCNGSLNMSDALATLEHLFLGNSLCCAEAADKDSDGRINNTDAISTLYFLFRGGAPPHAPWPDCGRAKTAGAFPCAQETCPRSI